MKSVLKKRRKTTKKATSKKYNLDELEVQFQLLSRLSNPEAILPETTSLKPLKKMLLRLMRVYSKIQIEFNKQTVQIMQNINQLLNTKIESQQKLIEELDSDMKRAWLGTSKNYISVIDEQLEDKFSALQKAIPQQKQTDYKSLYFPQFEDDFYLFQQTKFRGPYEMIKDRQKKYLPYIKTVKKLAEKHPFVDIGFGRGEFLEILKEQKLKHIMGVDTNQKYCDQAAKKGYEVVCDDGITFMQNYKGKLSGVSAFHVIEHLTFDQLFDLIYLAHMKLADGGFILFETPNIENVTVSSTSFYIDHTHISKLPPDFMKSMFEFFEFKKIEILYNIQIKDKYETDYDRFLFGPMDYAIVAYK